MTGLALPITGIYAGICGLLIMILGILVVVGRVKHKVDIGDGGNDGMIKAIRVHGNAAEYVPMAIILIALVELSPAPDWMVHTLGIALVVARLAHAQGLNQSLATSPGRFIGTTVTWLVMLAGGLTPLYYAFIA